MSARACSAAIKLQRSGGRPKSNEPSARQGKEVAPNAPNNPISTACANGGGISCVRDRLPLRAHGEAAREASATARDTACDLREQDTTETRRRREGGGSDERVSLPNTRRSDRATSIPSLWAKVCLTLPKPNASELWGADAHSNRQHAFPASHRRSTAEERPVGGSPAHKEGSAISISTSTG